MAALLVAVDVAQRVTRVSKGTQCDPTHQITEKKSSVHRPEGSENKGPAPEVPSSSQPRTVVGLMEDRGRGTFAKLNLIRRTLGSDDTSDPNRSYYTFAPCAVDCPRCYAIELQPPLEDTLTTDYDCKFFNRVTHLDHHIVKLLSQVTNKRHGYLRRIPIPAYLYEAKVPCVCCAKARSRCLHADIELWTYDEATQGAEGAEGDKSDQTRPIITDPLWCLTCSLDGQRCVWSRNEGEAAQNISASVTRVSPPKSVGEMLEDFGGIGCSTLDE